jgi:hypothetical protein
VSRLARDPRHIAELLPKDDDAVAVGVHVEVVYVHQSGVVAATGDLGTALCDELD